MKKKNIKFEQLNKFVRIKLLTNDNNVGVEQLSVKVGDCIKKTASGTVCQFCSDIVFMEEEDLV